METVRTWRSAAPQPPCWAGGLGSLRPWARLSHGFIAELGGLSVERLVVMRRACAGRRVCPGGLSICLGTPGATLDMGQGSAGVLSAGWCDGASGSPAPAAFHPGSLVAASVWLEGGKVHRRRLPGSQGDLVTKGQMVSEATPGCQERPSRSEAWSGQLHARLRGAGEGQASEVLWGVLPSLPSFPAFLTGSWSGLNSESIIERKVWL